MHFPDQPSPLRKILLAPLALLYAAGSRLHRALGLRPRPRDRAPRPPLVVIGSLRAGGAGKTAVTLELARYLLARGFRVGILAYWMHRRDAAIFTEILPDTDWRAGSDEAVLLARGAPGARVFVTRDRERAWAALGRAGTFDVLLSDDGLVDARLRDAFRVALVRPGENPGWTDLLPAGPYRLTAALLRRVDLVVRLVPSPPSGEEEEGNWFARAPALPPELNAEKPHWILCGLGSPASFASSLQTAGVRIAGCSAGPDHGLPNLRRARRGAERAGADRFLCSEKDRVKLENHPQRPARLFFVGESVVLSPAFLAAVDALLPPPTS